MGDQAEPDAVDVLVARPSDDYMLPGVGHIDDPYPLLEAARQACPVLHLGEVAMPWTGGRTTDTFVVYDHADVLGVLRDAEGYDSRHLRDIIGPTMGRTILEMDGEEHHRYRNLVAQAFRPRVLERWGESLLRPVADELIDGFVADGGCDLVRRFTFDYPARVIAAILGLPRADVSRFQSWAIHIIAYTAHPDEGLRAAEALRAYLEPIVAARRAEPGDDLISELVAAEIDGHRLTDEELYPFLHLLLPAGIETTFRALGNTLWGLLGAPDQLAAVRADPSLVPRAVEEGLRWEPPILFLTRWASCPHDVRGTTVPTDATLVAGLATANRDPAVHTDPAAFDVHREQHQSLTFGFGHHYCLGAHLARLEMRIALEQLLTRLPGLRLDASAVADGVRGTVFRSPVAVPVVWEV